MYMKKNKLAEIGLDKARRIVVFGDIHGDYAALIQGLDYVADDDLVLFLGDYADRGEQGVEVIEKIDSCISLYPDRYIALKGNHEDYQGNGDPLFEPCTLPNDVRRRGESWDEYFPRLSFFIDKLYLAALLPGYALFVHGGIFSGVGSAEDLRYPDRKIEEAVLWSDPGEEKGEQFNPRGAGFLFGPDVTENVFSGAGVSHLFRSHEPRKAAEGPAVEHGGRIVTLNSTGVYGGRPFVLVLKMDRLPETEEELKNAAVFL
jgi:3',5'-cyclic AMP phosphodiesterase CpdA